MSSQGTRDRLAGWLLSGAVAVALLCAAAAFALAAERKAPVLFLDLAALPPAAPAVAAVAEPAPQVADQSPAAPDKVAADEASPNLPKPDQAPDVPAAAAMSLPKVDVPVIADLYLPALPEKPVPVAETPAKKKVAKPDPNPKPDKKKKTAYTPKPDKKPKADQPTETTSASPSAPKAAGKTKTGGALSPAAYAKAVMKKVRSTKKKSGAGQGTVVVGFTIGRDGSLAAVKVLQSSGSATLDKIAVDHIRRSAPFPAPPEGAGSSYSFEFVRK